MLVCCDLYYVKNSKMVCAVAGRSPSAYRGLLATGIGIVKEEGFPRLYRGLTPACLRHCVYSGIRVGAYEFLREHVFLKVWPLLSHFDPLHIAGFLHVVRMSTVRSRCGKVLLAGCWQARLASFSVSCLLSLAAA